VKEREGGEEAPGGAEASRYDWFRDRVMFPIRNVAGEIIGFGGRVLDDSKPKYMNSPETALFNKGRELYGLFEARQALREHGHALVVEGYMDVVALAQHGFANAVATLGTACTAEHVGKLFRFTDHIVFSFDGDAAGRRAAGRALEAALPLATDLRTIKFLFLPAEHDPDSYVRELGTEAFAGALAAAVPLSRQLIEHCAEGQDLATAEGRARLLGQARPLWSTLPEEGALRRQILAEIAAAARLEMGDLASLWQLHQRAERIRPAAAPTQPVWPGTRPSHRGRRAPAAPADLALRLLLLHSDWWDRLPAADHQLLHEIGAAHGEAVSWLERQVTEHGALTWAALAEAAAGEPWLEQARAWVEAAAPEEQQQQYDDLERVLHRLWIERLDAQSRQLAAEGRTDREHLERLRGVNEQIRQHKAALATATPQP
jgi:DNA primase